MCPATKVPKPPATNSNPSRRIPIEVGATTLSKLPHPCCDRVHSTIRLMSCKCAVVAHATSSFDNVCASHSPIVPQIQIFRISRLELVGEDAQTDRIDFGCGDHDARNHWFCVSAGRSFARGRVIIMTVVENMFFPIASALVTEMAPEAELGIHVGTSSLFLSIGAKVSPLLGGVT